MNRSSDAIGGPLDVSLKVHKQEDGTYTATPVGSIGQAVGPTVGRTESEAINLCKQSLQKAVASGKI